MLFISGQVPQDADGHVPPDYPSQYRLAWANVEAQLKAAGMSFANLAKVTIFLSDRALIAQSAGLRRSILGDHCPAVTIVITGIYDEAWLLEIEAIAVA
jgi:enamine deaminase RidA (YjgF/YER057c/UK114 family)